MTSAELKSSSTMSPASTWPTSTTSSNIKEAELLEV